MKAGTGSMKITPHLGISLAGFSGPDRNAESVLDDLFLSVTVIEQDQKKVVLICADLLSFSNRTVRDIRDELCGSHGFREDEVLFNASHTHSGPQTTDETNQICGIYEESYEAFLKQSVMNLVDKAIGDLEEAEAYTGVTSCRFGVNRRRLTNGKAYFAPNKEGAVDNSVTVLKLVSEGRTKAVIVNYACHPSTIGGPHISADFPGAARNVIRNAHADDVTVMYMQGCSGNIKGLTSDDNVRFRPGTYDEVRKFGKELGDAVNALCAGQMSRIGGDLSSELMEIRLPLQGIPSREHIEKTAAEGSADEKAWAAEMLKKYDGLESSVPYTIQKIKIGDRFAIIGMAGEVCVEYAQYIKKTAKEEYVMALGYCNGTAGYIPATVMFSQGGYESLGSYIYYLYPSPFRTDVEDIIKKALKDMISGGRKTKAVRY